MKKFTAALPLLALAAAFPLTGCGTMSTHGAGNPPYEYTDGIYRGTRYDAGWYVGTGAWLGRPEDRLSYLVGFCVMTTDLACSLVLDTLFLPYDAFADPYAPEPRVENSESYRKPLTKPASETGGES